MKKPTASHAHVWNPVDQEWMIQEVLLCHPLGDVKAQVPKGTFVYDTKWDLVKQNKNNQTVKVRYFKPGMAGLFPAHIEWGGGELIARFSDVHVHTGREYIARFMSESTQRVIYDPNKELLQ